MILSILYGITLYIYIYIYRNINIYIYVYINIYIYIYHTCLVFEWRCPLRLDRPPRFLSIRGGSAKRVANSALKSRVASASGAFTAAVIFAACQPARETSWMRCASCTIATFAHSAPGRSAVRMAAYRIGSSYTLA